MDFFPAAPDPVVPLSIGARGPGVVMGYFDGNTVTALWNYAQHFAMNDNAYRHHLRSLDSRRAQSGRRQYLSGDAPEASTPKVVNLERTARATLIGDLDPTGDSVQPDGVTVQMAGKNIGDLLNAKGIQLGLAFMGGFDLTITKPTAARDAARRARRTASNGRPYCRLHSASRVVPVLCFDRQPDPYAADRCRRGSTARARYRPTTNTTS